MNLRLEEYFLGLRLSIMVWDRSSSSSSSGELAPKPASRLPFCRSSCFCTWLSSAMVLLESSHRSSRRRRPPAPAPAPRAQGAQGAAEASSILRATRGLAGMLSVELAYGAPSAAAGL